VPPPLRSSSTLGSLQTLARQQPTVITKATLEKEFMRLHHARLNTMGHAEVGG
jgi:hypothetical protein